MKLLIIEDDLPLLRSLERDLQESGFAVEVSWSGPEGLELARQDRFDLILLDGMLPLLDGWSLVRKLRSTCSTPVIMLTARDAVNDRIAGLNAGADDYLAKPFHFDELLARIHALIRRDSGARQDQLARGDLTLDVKAKAAHLKGKPVDLTSREFLLLRKLLSRQGAYLSHDYLASYLSYAGEEVAANTIEVHISRLRKKVGAATIRTVRGLGYTIDPA